MKISSFAPLIQEDSLVLILGSVPGTKSLQMQQYYAHPQNAFWKIMLQVLQEDDTADYMQRLEVLKKHHIALWDVIDTCERQGSLDADIRHEEANPVDKLLQDYPNIKAIFCNGQKSFKNLQKILGEKYPLPITVLPSTSPANARLSFSEKLACWNLILKPLHDE